MTGVVYEKAGVKVRLDMTPGVRQRTASALGLKAWPFFRELWKYGENSAEPPTWDGLLQVYDMTSADTAGVERLIQAAGLRAPKVVAVLRDAATVSEPPGVDQIDGNAFAFHGNWPGGAVLTFRVIVTDVDGDSATQMVDATVPPEGADATAVAILAKAALEPLLIVRARRRASAVTLTPATEHTAIHATVTWRAG